MMKRKGRGSGLRWLLPVGMVPVIVLLSAVPAGAVADTKSYQSYIYNAFGEAVAAPDGYLPARVLYGKDMGAGPLKEPSDLSFDPEGLLLIADSGNDRILVLDRRLSLVQEVSELTNEDGSADSLKNPTGVCKGPDGLLYIADKDNRRIVSVDGQGRIQRTYVVPETDEIAANFDFLPAKVAVDGTGVVYCLVGGLYRGAIQYDSEGSFIGFFGSNLVPTGIANLWDRFTRLFMTRAQLAVITRALPIEFSNFDLDPKGFLFTCSSAQSRLSSSSEIARINAAGANIFLGDRSATNVAWNRGKFGDLQSAIIRGVRIDTAFTDIDVDEAGFVNALDATRGRIFQYDSESGPTFVFGGLGDQAGTFRSPSAIESRDGVIYVLDSVKNSLTLFTPTPLGIRVRDAVTAYNEGKYIETIAPWEEILQTYSNFEPAYVGLGKAYYQLGRYEEAMASFRAGNDTEGHSLAFQGYRAVFVTRNFGWLALSGLGFVAAAILLARYVRKRKGKGGRGP